jgi:cytidyltransferase-like protein
VTRVYVSGCFDDIRSGTVRFLEEASRHGPVTALLRDDDSAAGLLGRAPKFPLGERRYFVEALRWVAGVEVIGADVPPDELPGAASGAIWVMLDGDVRDLPGSPAGERASPAKLAWCRARDVRPVVVGPAGLTGFRCPEPPPADRAAAGSGGRVALATGSFDWLHTGHVRFFEEAAAYGDLTVVVGHDANLRLLKGDGHPLVPEAERRYMVASIRHVARALVSSGSGWLDAEPEIAVVRPDAYVVNADGDKDEKRRFCEARGIEYVVLAREPKPGLPRRSSTDLRGF